MTPPIERLTRAVRVARGIRAVARRTGRGGRSRGRVPPPRLRFPCGHVESQRTVNRRLRTTGRAVWVACRSCSLITVIVARGDQSA